MLHRLTIKNYAIIDELTINFSEGMNIITGETGAGKSILLGALGLILGERADTKILYQEDAKCIVEADFEIEDKGLKAFFESNELDYERHTIIRREINQSGKSRAFINDTPVALNLLRELGEGLINLHNQHETLDLVKAGFQLKVVDALAKNQPALLHYQQKYQLYKKELKELDEATSRFKSTSAELDYLQFQLKEIAEAKLESGEQEKLESEQLALSNVEAIKLALQNATQTLAGNEMSVIDQLSEVQMQLKGVKSFQKDIAALSERLHSAYEELKDVFTELENIQEATLLEPARLNEVDARLDTIYRLEKKHAAKTLEDLLQIQQALESKIAAVDTNSAEIEKLKALSQAHFKDLVAQAELLHLSREKILRDFQTHVVVLLGKSGMPAASFKVDVHKLNPDQLNENGLTDLRFLFSANKGFMPLEIKDVASGGELSRLMLAIKSLVADAADLPTLIFDELDNGISGEVALKVGEIMKKLSRNHQLICITHLPQIARTGETHFYIYKETKDGRTYTRIKELKGEERVIEIAKMLAGDKLSEASLANARELITLN